MSYRDRSLDLREPHSGHAKVRIFGTTDYKEYDQTMLTGWDWRNIDRVNEWESDNSLDITKQLRLYPVLNGEKWSGAPPILDTRLTDWPITGQYSAPNPASYFGMPSTSDWSNYAAAVAAATNPSRPVVSLPTFLGEARELPKQLSDVPRQLRGAGRLLTPKGRGILGAAGIAELLADLNLAGRFGWRPLLSDLAKMMGFMKAVEERLAWLHHLMSGGSIKGRLRLPGQTGSASGGPLTTQSWLVRTRHTWETRYEAESWLTARWVLDPSCALPTSDEALFWLAWRAVLGLSFDETLPTAWELLPWSWFIDWFWNIGSWLQANNRFLPVVLESICWMRTSVSKTSYTLYTAPASWCQISGDYKTKMVVKQRRAINPLLATLPILPSIPALNWGQWSILASLWVQRRRRPKRRPAHTL